MRGEFLAVWSETWRELWQPLIDLRMGEKGEVVPEDIFADLYRELARALRTPLSPEGLADVIGDPAMSRRKFEETRAQDLASEPALVSFFEATHSALEELGGDELSNYYFNLLGSFIDKFSLRYDLRRPCALCPTLPGLVTGLVQHIRARTQADPHLRKLQHEFDETVRDLRHGRTEARIKSCLTKQYILIEGIANAQSGTSGETLGQRFSHASWPHPTLKAAAGNIYGFRSDYPGLGHSGNPKAVLRDVDDRELAGVSCMLLGVVPYVDTSVDLGTLYRDHAQFVASNRGSGMNLPAGRPNKSLFHRFSEWLSRLIGER